MSVLLNTDTLFKNICSSRLAEFKMWDHKYWRSNGFSMAVKQLMFYSVSSSLCFTICFYQSKEIPELVLWVLSLKERSLAISAVPSRKLSQRAVKEWGCPTQTVFTYRAIPAVVSGDPFVAEAGEGNKRDSSCYLWFPMLFLHKWVLSKAFQECWCLGTDSWERREPKGRAVTVPENHFKLCYKPAPPHRGPLFGSLHGSEVSSKHSIKKCCFYKTQGRLLWHKQLPCD
jgi:hypothetical protein